MLQRNTDLLMLPQEYCNLDEAPIAVVPGSTAASAMPLTPKILAAYLDAAFFASSDDRDCGSFDTQLRARQDDSTNLAVTSLENQDAANAQAIEAAFPSHRWMIPSGNRLALSFADSAVDIVTTPGLALTPATEL